MYPFKLTVFLLFFAVFSSVAQTTHHASISGHIHTSEGPMPGVIVLLKGTSLGTQTNADGAYHIKNIDPGTYTIVFTTIGFASDSSKISLSSGQHQVLNKTLKEDTTDQEAVEVIAQTDIETVKEQSYNVNVIDAEKYANTNSDINQVLNQSTGIRVRQEGGLGSSFNLMLNGFSGNQIRYFIDGIPMTNFGSALTLNNIPINVAERIEVYKGVVPVWLGADALGGAVNVVTNQKIRNYVDASYSFGSFNTHRASLNTRYTDSSGFTVRLDGYLNYSDNDFTISASIANPQTGKFGPKEKYKHFHDRYKSGAVVAEIGVVDKKYADKLLFGVIVSGNNKQLQQGASMMYVYGEAFQTNQTVIPTLKYSKSNFFLKGLTVTGFGSVNFSQNRSVDTCARKYSWDGTYRQPLYNLDRGEINDYKTFYIYSDRNTFGMATLNYDITEHHNLSFNYTYSNMYRQQRDDITPDRLAFNEATVTRNTLGLGYKLTAPDNRFSGTLFTKMFLLNADLSQDTIPVKTNIHKMGYGSALSYFILRKVLQAKISFENTYRVPDDAEYLGDGLLIVGNPYLKPEHSQNLNISLRLTKKISRLSDIAVEGGFVYRNAEDFIRTTAVGPKSVYRNERNVRVTGFEAGIQYSYRKIFFFEVNGTYQNIINVDKYDPPGSNRENYLYLLRLPNIPYLFGNANFGVKINKVGFSHSNLNLNLSLNYVEGFYLFWPTLGDPQYKREIPTQFTQNATITYAMHDNRYNISFECRNLTDVAVYDYFNVQKPGRSFSIKLRYFLKK